MSILSFLFLVHFKNINSFIIPRINQQYFIHSKTAFEKSTVQRRQQIQQLAPTILSLYVDSEEHYNLDPQSSNFLIGDDNNSNSNDDNTDSDDDIFDTDGYDIKVYKEHPRVLESALKHCRTWNVYSKSTVMAKHTEVAFLEAQDFVNHFYLTHTSSSSSSSGISINHDNDNDNDNHHPSSVQSSSSSSSSSSSHQSIKTTQSGTIISDIQKYVILDSGCGVGLSSIKLALQNPNIPVIAIDRSVVRLSKNKYSNYSRPVYNNNNNNNSNNSSSNQILTGLHHQHDMINSNYNDNNNNNNDDDNYKEDENDNDDDYDDDSNYDGQQSRHRKKSPSTSSSTSFSNTKTKRIQYDRPPNLLFLRAELTDFWIMVTSSSDWIIKAHYILYPNPYPKNKHLSRRWHGHPVFPCLLALGGVLNVRSNWPIYCEEMNTAVSGVLNTYFGSSSGDSSNNSGDSSSISSDSSSSDSSNSSSSDSSSSNISSSSSSCNSTSVSSSSSSSNSSSSSSSSSSSCTSVSNNSNCSPVYEASGVAMPHINATLIASSILEAPSAPQQQQQPIMTTSSSNTHSNSKTIWPITLTSIPPPISDPITHFERKYSSAGKTVFNFEVDLGLRNATQRRGMLYRLSMNP